MFRKLFSTPLTKEQQKILGISAPLFEKNGMSHKQLYGMKNSKGNRADIANMLDRDWGVNSRESLLGTLSDLTAGGHNKEYLQIQNFILKLSEEGLKDYLKNIKGNYEQYCGAQLIVNYRFDLLENGIEGWDIVRYAGLCRWGALVGYITDDEAWEYMREKYSVVVKKFKSWQEFSLSFSVGRQYWISDLSEEFSLEMNNLMKRLLFIDESVYDKIGALA